MLTLNSELNFTCKKCKNKFALAVIYTTEKGVVRAIKNLCDECYKYYYLKEKLKE